MVRHDPYTHLSTEDRLDRFCAIMAKAVFLAEEGDKAKQRRENQAVEAETEQSMDREDQPQTAERPEDRIIHFLAQVGEASPRDIQNQHDLSRSKTYRLLAELKQAGKVEQFGRTRSIRYRLAS
tara:strand:- start:33901 stop:34272 length:372 start_codon:yes stop_codon:yes gene_type:complete